MAAQLLDAGWQVLGLARRPAPINHDAYRHVRLDLSDLPAVQEFFSETLADEFGLATRARVGLVNNAALLGPVMSLQDIPLDDLEQAYRVNTIVPIWLTGWFAKVRQGKCLRVVNVSSGAASNPVAGWTAYCSTKAALHMAGEVLGAEASAFAEKSAPTQGDLALLSYSPGLVDTEMQELLRSHDDSRFPGIQRFLDYQREGALNPAAGPAGEIVTFLNTDGQPPSSTTRYQG